MTKRRTSKYPDDDPRRWNSVYTHNCAMGRDPWEGVPPDMVDRVKEARRIKRRASYVSAGPNTIQQRTRAAWAVYKEFTRLRELARVQDVSAAEVLGKLARVDEVAWHGGAQ